MSSAVRPCNRTANRTHWQAAAPPTCRTGGTACTCCSVDGLGRSLGPCARIWSDLPDLVRTMLAGYRCPTQRTPGHGRNSVRPDRPHRGDRLAHHHPRHRPRLPPTEAGWTPATCFTESVKPSRTRLLPLGHQPRLPQNHRHRPQCRAMTAHRPRRPQRQQQAAPCRPAHASRDRTAQRRIRRHVRNPITACGECAPFLHPCPKNRTSEQNPRPLTWGDAPPAGLEPATLRVAESTRSGSIPVDLPANFA